MITDKAGFQPLPFTIIFAFFNFIGFDAGKRICPRSVRLLSQCDLLIDLAGVSFIDGREKFLPFNILTLAPAFFSKFRLLSSHRRWDRFVIR